MGAAASDYFTTYADVQYGFLDEELGILNFHALAAKGDYHRVSACLKKGLDPNGPTFDDDDDYAREDTPMICAARGNSVRRGRKRHLKTLAVLLHFGGDVNKCNFLEQTPLYIACEKNLLSIAEWLVAHGSDVNRSTKVGVSPLLCAYRNGNPAIVKLLLDHGAKTIDPPRDFCSIQFPTIAKELRGENVDTRRGGSEDGSDSSEDDVTTVRPVSSYLRIRPLRKMLGNADTTAAPSVRPTTAAVPPSEQMRREIEPHQQRQQQQRDAILSDLDETQRIQDQCEYREKLAIDNTKRKASRRRERERVNYEKYIARVEETRQQVLAPLRRATTSHGDGTQGSHEPAVVHLHWNREADRGIRTAPSRVGRPKWTAQQVATTQVAGRGSSYLQGDEKLMHESRVAFDALQAQRDRREQLRVTYTAPTLPPLGKRESWDAIRDHRIVR